MGIPISPQQNGAVGFRQPRQNRLNALGSFLVYQFAIGCGLFDKGLLDGFIPIGHAQSASIVIENLVPRDAENPGAKAGVSAVSRQAAPGLEKHLLHDIVDGLSGRRQTPLDEGMHRTGEVVDELGSGFAVLSQNGGDEVAFPGEGGVSGLRLTRGCEIQAWASL